MPRKRYRTKQRVLVEKCLSAQRGRYLSVDEVCAIIGASGEGSVGRTTVYRNLELMSREGAVTKVTGPNGESGYRIVADDANGQLMCLDCGRALPLDCHAASEFSAHVDAFHGFSIEPARTVLYGHCAQCREGASRE